MELDQASWECADALFWVQWESQAYCTSRSVESHQALERALYVLNEAVAEYAATLDVYLAHDQID